MLSWFLVLNGNQYKNRQFVDLLCFRKQGM